MTEQTRNFDTKPDVVSFGSLKSFISNHRLELNALWDELLDSGQFIGGEVVQAFENEFAEFIGAENVVGVGNGTDAIEIAIRTLDLAPGSEILVPANTYVGTVEAVLNQGMTPVFLDVGEDLRIDLTSIGPLMSSKTAAMIVVHMYGRLEQIDLIKEFKEQTGIRVIEDCAQAHGLRDREGRHAGTFFDAGTFSFFPGKNLGGFGDGGAVTFQSLEHSEAARRIANHGRLAKFDHFLIGRNSRLDALHASILAMRLRTLEDLTAKRKANARALYELLPKHPELTVPNRGHVDDSAFHVFTINTPRRDSFREFLALKGIETGIHYPISANAEPAFANWYRLCPVAEQNAATTVSLPVGEHLNDEQLLRIGREVKSYLESAR